jgi:CTP:molybdopterin cytidylyltransferase MocA
MAKVTPKIGAVVLAGGDVPPTLVNLCAYRALLRLRGRYMLDYLLETLRTVEPIVETVLLIPEPTLSELDGLPGLKVASSDIFSENLRRGSEALSSYDLTHLLFVTGDIPLVTPAGMDDYIRASIESDAAITYPIIPKFACERRFPGARRTYVRIREGIFTGGNAIVTRVHQLDLIYDLIQRLYLARKNPMKLAGILGWVTVFKMLTGTLNLPYLEALATRILGAPVRALITEHAEIGFDVDKADDLAAVERALQGGVVA